MCITFPTCLHGLKALASQADVLKSVDGVAQVDSALCTAHNLLFPKGLESAMAASHARHDATVEAAHEARVAYLKKVIPILCPPQSSHAPHMLCTEMLLLLRIVDSILKARRGSFA
jgi:hypothetical protein